MLTLNSPYLLHSGSDGGCGSPVKGRRRGRASLLYETKFHPGGVAEKRKTLHK
jgi:hypothetical protein